mmetsp:Transcript_53335/g.114016  ORF Transcript_53335/g.114016 Transcript_53335/m.114016 type:complete len:237 (-) Transcript_53335:2389-3099(-)
MMLFGFVEGRDSSWDASRRPRSEEDAPWLPCLWQLAFNRSIKKERLRLRHFRPRSSQARPSSDLFILSNSLISQRSATPEPRGQEEALPGQLPFNRSIKKERLRLRHFRPRASQARQSSVLVISSNSVVSERSAVPEPPASPPFDWRPRCLLLLLLGWFLCSELWLLFVCCCCFLSSCADFGVAAASLALLEASTWAFSFSMRTFLDWLFHHLMPRPSQANSASCLVKLSKSVVFA